MSLEDTYDVHLRVVAYNGKEGYHECLLDDGTNVRVDLMVNGDFPKDVAPESLVGKKVVAEYTFPYISIASGVRLLEEEKDGKR